MTATATRNTARVPACLGVESGFVTYTVPSSSAPNEAYRIRVHIRTRAITCTCNDFVYRRADHVPSLDSPDEHLCKHCLAVAQDFPRRGFNGVEPPAYQPIPVNVEPASRTCTVCMGEGFHHDIAGTFRCSACKGSGRIAIR